MTASTEFQWTVARLFAISDENWSVSNNPRRDSGGETALGIACVAEIRCLSDLFRQLFK